MICYPTARPPPPSPRGNLLRVGEAEPSCLRGKKKKKKIVACGTIGGVGYESVLSLFLRGDSEWRRETGTVTDAAQTGS